MLLALTIASGVILFVYLRAPGSVVALERRLLRAGGFHVCFVALFLIFLHFFFGYLADKISFPAIVASFSLFLAMIVFGDGLQSKGVELFSRVVHLSAVLAAVWLFHSVCQNGFEPREFFVSSRFLALTGLMIGIWLQDANLAREEPELEPGPFIPVVIDDRVAAPRSVRPLFFLQQ